MRVLTPIVFAFAALALVAVAVIGWIGYSFRQFEPVTVAGSLSCQSVFGLAGATDFALVPGTEKTYVSTREGAEGRGSILRFDTGDPLDAGSWRDRTNGQPALFAPRGIDLYSVVVDETQAVNRLFVVNAAGPEVLLYDVDAQGDLHLRDRFSDPRLTSPRDVVATGTDSFYVTNDAAAGRNSVRGRIEFVLGLPSGQIFHHDGTSLTDVADGLSFPGGLAVAPKGDTLYVAEMRGRRVARFQRDPGTDLLRAAGAVSLESFPGNVSVDELGNLIVASLPHPLSAVAYEAGHRAMAPSSILRVRTDGAIETLLRDDGAQISAASASLRVGRRLVVGASGADRILMCEGG